VIQYAEYLQMRRRIMTDGFVQDIDIITERKDGTKAAPPVYVPLNSVLEPF